MAASLTSQCSIGTFTVITPEPDNFVIWPCLVTSFKNEISLVWTKPHLDLGLNLGFHTLKGDID